MKVSECKRLGENRYMEREQEIRRCGGGLSGTKARCNRIAKEEGGRRERNTHSINFTGLHISLKPFSCVSD